MTHYTLTLFETTGIQDYVFGSNELAQNIGASELVYRATTAWLAEALAGRGLKTNGVSWDEKEGLSYDDQSIAADRLDGELVYAGGGNAVLLFADPAEAREVARLVTRRALVEARGMELVVLHQDGFDWDNASLSEAHSALRRRMGERKRNPSRSLPLPGLGVTAACAYTGLPVIGAEDNEGLVGPEAVKKARRIRGRAVTPPDPRQISAEVAHKLQAEATGKERLKRELGDALPPEFELVYDFDDFGVKGESSYVAVIHTDGNRMGQRFEKLADDHPTAAHNAAYVRAVRGLSRSIEEQAKKALRETVRLLVASRDDSGRFGGLVPTPLRDGNRQKPLLPFRPIVFGGDDATLVCEGRLGLSVAAAYLRAFTAGPLDDGQPIFARAGVAVVKSHYPFSRAYDLADKLAASAKAGIDGLRLPDETGVTVMDWHFATSGVILSLGEVREREYRTQDGKSLLMRPLRLTPLSDPADRWHNWQTFTDLMAAFQNDAPPYKRGDWSGRRNKVKALRDALRGGPPAVRLFLTNYRLTKGLPDIPGRPDMSADGWQGNECGYFDAVEALDFYVALNNKRTQPAAETQEATPA
jgi:hypothetical protein